MEFVSMYKWLIMINMLMKLDYIDLNIKGGMDGQFHWNAPMSNIKWLKDLELNPCLE